VNSSLLILLLAFPVQDLSGSLETLRAVGPEGRGNQEAAPAWREVTRADASALPRILSAMDGVHPLAANWLRAAFETIAERELERGAKLPVAELEAFILETHHAPRARRLAYEWLVRCDSTARG